ncbi:GntR family transcriptional regulator [Pelagibius litoralis]|uniref:GntR family transcriptional regulator n=1 Tax=Pelagibius litoralis TaxID=374515 RepID=A0A967K9K0_9PROT|nr:GntR family transcriptional regulator [Pelagibius litoralis]NIA69927.1 GntR family transcriptional regulator [Pelagibius litoralis]
MGDSSLKTGEKTDGDAGRRYSRLDPEARVPLYHQIFIILRNRIYGGEITPGDLVPGEQELCHEFGVSRITAKRALNELADAGLVVRERGRGTRVIKRPPAPAVTASIEGWLENISLMGLATEARVLDFGYVPANEDIATALGVEQGAQVQRAVRVRILDDEPMSFLVTYVPADIGRHYDRDDLNTTPLLHLLERAGVDVASARQTISATIADGEVAAALSVHAGAPLIEVRRVVRDGAERPVEYIRVLYRPDLYRFEMSMRRVQEEEGMRWTTQGAAPSAAGGRSRKAQDDSDLQPLAGGGLHD